MPGDTMNDKDAMRERLSALADGELQGEEFACAVAHAGTPEGQSDWRMYHLIGDTLRSGQVPHVADPAWPLRNPRRSGCRAGQGQGGGL